MVGSGQKLKTSHTFLHVYQPSSGARVARSSYSSHRIRFNARRGYSARGDEHMPFGRGEPCHLYRRNLQGFFYVRPSFQVYSPESSASLLTAPVSSAPSKPFQRFAKSSRERPQQCSLEGRCRLYVFQELSLLVSCSFFCVLFFRSLFSSSFLPSPTSPVQFSRTGVPASLEDPGISSAWRDKQGSVHQARISSDLIASPVDSRRLAPQIRENLVETPYSFAFSHVIMNKPESGSEMP